MNNQEILEELKRIKEDFDDSNRINNLIEKLETEPFDPLCNSIVMVKDTEDDNWIPGEFISKEDRKCICKSSYVEVAWDEVKRISFEMLAKTCAPPNAVWAVQWKDADYILYFDETDKIIESSSPDPFKVYYPINTDKSKKIKLR